MTGHSAFIITDDGNLFNPNRGYLSFFKNRLVNGVSLEHPSCELFVILPHRKRGEVLDCMVARLADHCSQRSSKVTLIHHEPSKVNRVEFGPGSLSNSGQTGYTFNLNVTFVTEEFYELFGEDAGVVLFERILRVRNEERHYTSDVLDVLKQGVFPIARQGKIIDYSSFWTLNDDQFETYLIEGMA
jgi:hypothetical protein